MDNRFNSDNDLEIIDVEHYHDTSDKVFSHPSLVMSAIRKCLELGSKEMRNGWFNERMDKRGFLIRTYIEDTRQAFISSVKMVMALMQPDYDKEATDNIQKIKEELKKEYDKLVEEEKKDYNSLSPMDFHSRISNGLQFVEGYLNKDLPYYNLFIDTQVDSYREIFGELNKLTERLDYYKGEDLEA